MPELNDLLDELKDVDAKRDFDGLRNVRERIVEMYFDSDAATEALYKLGLDLLFRERKLDLAVEKFEQAASRKHVFWSAAARTSLGLCYYHQHRAQKALFELRKVAYAKMPSEHSVTALMFIENIFETEGKHDEVVRIRRDRIVQLEQLIANTKHDQAYLNQRGTWLYQLALALRDQQEYDKAAVLLQEARALGRDVLGMSLYQSVIDALAC